MRNNAPRLPLPARNRRRKRKEEKGAALVAEISVDKLTSNRILLRGGGGGGREGEGEGGGSWTRRKVIENRSGLASSEPQLFRVFLRGYPTRRYRCAICLTNPARHHPHEYVISILLVCIRERGHHKPTSLSFSSPSKLGRFYQFGIRRDQAMRLRPAVTPSASRSRLEGVRKGYRALLSLPLRFYGYVERRANLFETFASFRRRVVNRPSRLFCRSPILLDPFAARHAKLHFFSCFATGGCFLFLYMSVKGARIRSNFGGVSRRIVMCGLNWS